MQHISGGAQALLVLNASPFHIAKRAEREARMGAFARKLGLPLVYAHMVGGQDEVVFDGASFAVNAQGERQLRWQLDLLGTGIITWTDGRTQHFAREQ